MQKYKANIINNQIISKMKSERSLFIYIASAKMSSLKSCPKGSSSTLGTLNKDKSPLIVFDWLDDSDLISLLISLFFRTRIKKMESNNIITIAAITTPIMI